MMNKTIKLIILCLVFIFLILSVVLFPVKDWLMTLLQLINNLLVRLLQWTQGLGLWAPVFVVAFYIVACVIFLPGSVLTLGAGFIFGLPVGTITVSVGSTLGACTAFLVGRTFGRDWISGKIAGNKKFATIDNAVGQQGFKIVLLTRLSPVFPFNLLNYAFGLTNVSFARYALASWIGMLPGTIMYVYFGAGLRSLADAVSGKVETGMAGQIFFWVGMAAAIVVAVFVAGVARKALRQSVSTEET